MEFSQVRRRRQSEPALPMINVVFLLLIFFLMSAQIVAPPPFEVTPPNAGQGSTPQEDRRLYLSAEGELAMGEARGSEVWRSLAMIPETERGALLVRADAKLHAAELAGVLGKLAALGFEKIQLATVPR